VQSPHYRKVSGTACAAVAILAVHAMLLAWIAAVNSPTVDEPAHLASGINHWQYGRFDLYRVNPPLVRMIAAVPVLFSDANVDWANDYDARIYTRSEFAQGRRFLAENGESTFRYFTWARWALIPVCLAGGWVSFRWACLLFGSQAGLVAIALYCFCPNLLAMGASITPDAAAASLGIVAGYAFWRWLMFPGWSSTVFAGVALGLAELTKTTWLILFVLWPVLWLVCKVSRKRLPAELVHSEELRPTAVQLLSILAIAIYLINLCYAFEGSFKPLGEYSFVSRALSGQVRPPSGGNRFSKTWLANLPIPLPENYIRGIDVQRFDFEKKKWSYLCGEQRFGGWWYYYLYAGLVKTPVGTLAILALSLALPWIGNGPAAGWRHQIFLLLPAVSVLILVSSQTGFNRYYRYVLPALPYFYVGASRVASVVSSRSWMLSSAVIAFVLVSVVESLCVAPNSLSFFNCIAGGPANGHRHLLDANIDWGQDLLRLKYWHAAHRESRPLHLAYFDSRFVDPIIAGIDFVPVIKTGRELDDHRQGITTPWEPGWYAISLNHVYGYRHLDDDKEDYTCFQKLKPVDIVGTSIYLYHVLPTDAERLNVEMKTKQ